MRTFSLFALLAGSLVVGSSLADEKEKAKEKPLTGTYTRKTDELTLKLVFKKDNKMDLHVKIGCDSCVMITKYTKEKDGTYKCEVTKFEKVGDFPFVKEAGYKFSFKVEMKDKKLVMSDLNGDDIGAEQKQTAEGDYELVTD